jgi:CubicO group peptidase (beta-lactamase class C family)
MNQLLRYPSILFVLAQLVACGQEPAPGNPVSPVLSEADTEFAADTAEYFESLEKLGFAGGLLVTRGDETIIHTGYGMADREANIPWSADTISTMGSITKQFTGAAILLLQEDGLLKVDDPITKYFSNVPADKATISLHQLLTHSSGIVELEGVDDWDPIDWEPYFQRVMDQPLEFEPGSSFSYSNTGYSLLAAIIEQITGESYERFLRERLLLPAGLTDTGYKYAGWDDARVASGYQDDERWGNVLERSVDEDGPYWALRGNGGIHSTTVDMARWGKVLMRGALLSQQSMDAYWEAHVDEGFGDSFYGYGWVVMQGPGERRVITHNGGNTIFFADMAIYPDDDIVFVVQTNVATDWPVSNRMLEMMAERLFNGVPYPVTPDLVDINPEAIASLAGQYIVGDGDEALGFTVRNEGSELIVSPGNAKAFAVMHSTRAVDFDRCSRLSVRIEEIVSAYVENDDLNPLYQAYGGSAPIEALEEGWAARKQRDEAEFGELTGYAILGTALRNGRDVTVARHLFKNGHSNTAFVWDPQEEESLLGRSGRGLNPELRYVPTGKATFGSWDGGFSDSRSLRFTADGMSLTLVTSTDEIVASRDVVAVPARGRQADIGR